MSYLTIRRVSPLQSRRVLEIVCIAVCAATVTLVIPAQAQNNSIENLRSMGKAFASVAKKVSPAVVFIEVEKKVKAPQSMMFLSPFGGGDGPFGDDLFGRFFGQPFPRERFRQQPQPPKQEDRVVGQGSGFIVSADGYILTNNHVVGDADKIVVKLEDGREFIAKTIGTDPHSDVAVIKIDAKNLPLIPLGNSDALEVGEWVIAVGNPFGLSHTLTAGIVSAKGRSSVGITDYENFIQTDAAINPGNSGGPLVDLEGRAVGMNTAIFTRTGGSAGIGFAIPINMAKAIRDQLIETGSVTRGYLGVMIQNLTPDLAKGFGMKDHKGVLVVEVSEDSPAEKAGLKQGDVIVEFDGKPVKKVGAFRNRVALNAPEAKKEIIVWRDGKRKVITITIGKLPAGNQIASAPSHTLDKLGLTVKTLTKDIAEQLGYQGETGVVVTHVNANSVAALAGIKAGSLIQEVNRKRATNADELKRVIEQTPANGTVLLLIKEGEYSRYVALKVER